MKSTVKSTMEDCNGSEMYNISAASSYGLDSVHLDCHVVSLQYLGIYCISYPLYSDPSACLKNAFISIHYCQLDALSSALEDKCTVEECNGKEVLKNLKYIVDPCGAPRFGINFFFA